MAASHFTGGRPYEPDDPCSVRYDAETEIVDGELLVAVVAEQHPKTVPSGVACDAMGYPHSVDVLLPQPFTGSVIRDRLSGETLVPRPSPRALGRQGARVLAANRPAD